MKSWLRCKGIICIVGFALFVGLSYTGAGQAIAGITCKLTSGGHGIPAQFQARKAHTSDPVVLCLDTSGSGCTLEVGSGSYEVRCYPWDVANGMVCENVPKEVNHPTPIVEKRLLIVDGGGSANFTATDHVQGLSTYE